ncbi:MULTISPECIES: sigma-70 family RNA polymerase sigma factor [unclassified Streptomyces]|uniref:sigma-70 family RNA polymerase sigma factor n=1 Tax=unclassified Streptomyces TaxID=2593676 RepID=UPI00380DCF0E
MTEHGSSRTAERSDAELAAGLRDGSDDAAMAELYARHRAAVLTYARTCCRDAHTAEDLAAEAFARTLEAVRSGGGPTGPWRPYLLTVVRRTAIAWCATARRSDLTDDVERCAAAAPTEEGGEEFALRGEEGDLVVRSFRSLPERWQAVLWQTLVEGESAQRVGTMLGLSASGVWSLAERAREGLREAYLTEHAHGPRASDECRRYGPLLATAVRRGGRRTGRHLDRHLTGCRACRRAFRDLRDLNSRLRVVLPAAVLLWGAEKYTAAYGTTASLAAGGAGGAVPVPGADVASAAAAAKPVATAAGVSVGAVAAIGALVYVALPAAPEIGPPAPPVVRQAVAPPAPTRAPSPSPSTSSDPAPVESLASVSEAAAPTVYGERTRLRIDATGLCMEIPGGSTEAGVQPREAQCNGAAHQVWDVMPQEKRRRVVLRNAGTDLCLSHTGTTTDGAPVRQAACDPADPLQVWTMNRQDDRGTAGIFTSDNMYLGLKEWAPGARGEPYDALIATTRHYYLSPSLHFRTDW